MILDFKKSLGIFLGILLFAGSALGAAFQFGGLRLDALKITSSGSATALTNADKQMVVLTGSSTGVIKLPNATTLQAGYFYSFSNESSGNLVVSNSSSTPLVTLTTGQSAMLLVTSAATSGGPWSVFKGAGAAGSTAGNCYIFMQGASGYGSTATKVRIYSTTISSCSDGSATYATSASVGDSVTINTEGNYCFGRKERAATGDYVGFSKSASSLTTNVDSLAGSENLGGYEGSATMVEQVWHHCGHFAAGVVIRAQSRGAASGSGATDVLFYFNKTN